MDENIKRAIDKAWDTRAPKMDWLGMEQTLRDYVKLTGNKDVDEIVAAFTKRGHVLPPEMD